MYNDSIVHIQIG